MLKLTLFMCVDSISDYNRLKDRIYYFFLPTVTHAQHTKCIQQHVSRGGLFKLN